LWAIRLRYKAMTRQAWQTRKKITGYLLNKYVELLSLAARFVTLNIQVLL